MEYLLVRFGDEDRGVVIDGKSQGRTNQILQVERGTHEIGIEGPPFDFYPSRIKVVLKKTTSLSPKEVTFEKM
jgi:hypothetical protein